MITTMHSDQNASPPRVEVITSIQRRRRWPTAEKIRLVEETMQPGMSVSYVARRAGVAPSLLFNWRRRMLEGGLRAVQADEDVVGTSRVREPERRVREAPARPLRDQQGGPSRRMVVRQRLGVHRQGHARHRNGLGP
jgi:transposase